MNSHSVPSHTWTRIPDTGLSVKHESGSVQMVVVYDGEVELPARGAPWRVRWLVPTDITTWEGKEFRAYSPLSRLPVGEGPF